MNKVSGLQSDFAYLRYDESRTIIGYGLNKPEGAEFYEWYEVYLYKTQKNNISLNDVKNAIINDINEKVKSRIIGGFVWNDKPVWLSEENQMNFAQAVVPARFKIGEEEDGTPVYHEFTTKTEMSNFVEACVQWKQQCLLDGWAEKDAIDWEPYKEYFPEQEDID